MRSFWCREARVSVPCCQVTFVYLLVLSVSVLVESTVRSLIPFHSVDLVVCVSLFVSRLCLRSLLCLVLLVRTLLISTHNSSSRHTITLPMYTLTLLPSSFPVLFIPFLSVLEPYPRFSCTSLYLSVSPSVVVLVLFLAVDIDIDTDIPAEVRSPSRLNCSTH